MSTLDPDPRTPGVTGTPVTGAAPPATDLVMPQLRVMHLDQIQATLTTTDRATFLRGVIAARGMYRHAEVLQSAPLELNRHVVTARGLPAAAGLLPLLTAGPLTPSVASSPSTSATQLNQAVEQSLRWYEFLQGRFAGLVLLPGASLNLEMQANARHTPTPSAIRVVLTGDAKCRIGWLHAGRPTHVRLRASGGTSSGGSATILGFRLSLTQPVGVAQSLLPIARAAGASSSGGGNFPLEYLVRMSGPGTTSWESHQILFGRVTEEYGFLTSGEAASPAQWQSALP